MTVEDLLVSFPREDIEESPFDLLLFLMGIEVEAEPWGRYASDDAWNLDAECVEGDGAYVEAFRNLARISGRAGDIVHVDMAAGTAWVEYDLGQGRRRIDAVVQDDWIDGDVVAAFMEDLATNGRDFYPVDNGQATIWFYLDASSAAAMNDLTGGAVKLP